MRPPAAVPKRTHLRSVETPVGVLLSQLVSQLIKQRRIQVNESPPGRDLIGPAETIQETGGRHEYATGLRLPDATLVNHKQILLDSVPDLDLPLNA